MPPPAADTPEFARNRFTVFGAAFLLYLGYALSDWGSKSDATIAVAVVLLVAFIATYLIAVPRGAFHGDRRYALASPVAMLAITAAYLSIVGRGGLVMLTYTAVAMVIGWPRRVAVPCVLALAAGTVVLPEHVAAFGLRGEQWSIGLPIMVAGGCMLLVTSQVRTGAALARSRSEVEQLAADQERLRIARDLHDILGHALTTVTVKAELAARLIDRDPVRARQEMDEVAVLARQGLADVRATVGGYREVTLAVELATAREVLVAAGMTPDLPASTEVVPGELRELFGWVVREGVTNAVRHSRARTVRVAVEERAVEVCDDGEGGPCGAGSGLAGLRERVAVLGGRLITGPGSAGGFRLRVEV